MLITGIYIHYTVMCVVNLNTSQRSIDLLTNDPLIVFTTTGYAGATTDSSS